MWTFPVILSLCVLTFFSTAWIVRAISPSLWVWSMTHNHILIAERTTPEIETLIYGLSLAVGVCLFFILFQFAKSLRKHRLFTQILAFINVSVALYLLTTTRTLFELDRIQPIPLGICILVVSVAARRRKISSYVLEGLIGLVVLRFMVSPLIELHLGNQKLYTFDGFLRYAVAQSWLPIALGIFLIFIRRIEFIHKIVSWFTLRRLSVLLGGSIALSLLFLMTQSRNPTDTFFTMLPAYQATHGGTLLVNAMSQYGLLYLAPWMVWFILLPNVPVSFEVGTVITAVLLCLYFLLFIRITRTLATRRLLFVLTVVASYYFTVLVRYSNISDMVSVVSTPAFTPLRFGLFIIPLWFLLRLTQTGDAKFIRNFLIASAILFFYSFEIGVGMSVSALCIVLLYWKHKSQSRAHLIRYIGVFTGTLILCASVLVVYAQLTTGAYPDFSQYWYFATLYGSGFLTTPIGGKTVLLLPLGISLLGLFIGLVRIVQQKQIDGLLFCYLACIEFAMLPYYMSRSMNQTLYSISLPFLLLCALCIEQGASIVRNNRLRFAAWSMVVVCSTVLLIGFSRGSELLARTIAHGAEITSDAGIYVHKAFTVWDIRTSAQYNFLSIHLPDGCPLLSFDEKEFELIPALGVPPATQYAFVYGFIISKEQIDRLIPHNGSKEICIFVSDKFLRQKNPFSYGAYLYFFGTYRPYMTEIAVDDELGYTLFTLPSNLMR